MELGQRDSTLLAPAAKALPWGVAGALSAAISALSMRGFTVDDALISIRYARHLASGAGYRFNVDGASTDGVTPLPWAFVLAPLSHTDALTVLMRASVLGFVCAVATGALLGVAVARAKAHASARVAALVLLAMSVPFAAHAMSGMETSLATLVATLAAMLLARGARHATLAAAIAGAAASLRPEMLPWALVVAAIGGDDDEPLRALASRAKRVALAMAPFAACVVARLVAFHHVAPLAVAAKPSDLSHGLAYAGASAIVTLAPIVACAPLALVKAPRAAQALTIAGVAHYAAVAVAGGDWMAYARLATPIIPSLLLAFVVASPGAHRLASVGRVAVALVAGVFFLVYAAPAGHGVRADRLALVEAARAHFATSKRIAALDIGWLSAVTEAPIVDLAGLTDPEIAVLPGGHTSKRVDAAMLMARHVDTLVLFVNEGLPEGGLEAWPSARYFRTVENRLAASPYLHEKLTPEGFIPLGSKGGGYVVLRLRPEEDSPR